MPSTAEKYFWTRHSRFKLRQYHLSESRVKRIIRHPLRVEEGILQGAIACMQPAGGAKYSEIWAMYVLIKPIPDPVGDKSQTPKIKIITAWRYPGRSPERNPIPQNILQEVKRLIY